MKKGEGAILTESVIYIFMNQKFIEKSLKLRPIYLNGQRYNRKQEYIPVRHLKDITDTSFPDIEEISIGIQDGIRPAEVKFITSKFDYHKNKKYKNKYAEFKKNNGCLIVFRHDTFPKGLWEDYKIDIFELHKEDFISYVKENFERLFYQQVQHRDYTNIWLMYAGPGSNFYKGNNITMPAYESKRWCSLKKLTPLDLTKGDKIIFLNTKGSGQQDIRESIDLGKSVNRNWILKELWVCTARTTCLLREEYCLLNNINPNSPLWYSESTNGKHYPYVFEFDIDYTLKELDIDLYSMLKDHYRFVNDVKAAFFDNEKLINSSVYLDALQFILKSQLSVISKLKEEIKMVGSVNRSATLDFDFRNIQITNQPMNIEREYEI